MTIAFSGLQWKNILTVYVIKLWLNIVLKVLHAVCI
jgi:hypothetical protein